LKFLFIVQGEGRGHFSQALALYEILIDKGHEICAVMAGLGNKKVLPGYFDENFDTPLLKYKSPFFIRDKNKKGILVFISIMLNLLKSYGYIKTTKLFNNKIKEYSPDVVVNFYEPLLGLTYLIFRPSVPQLCLGHHFIIGQKTFPLPKKMWFSQKLLLFMNRITSIGSKKIMALSYNKAGDFANKKYKVAPPLLRNAVLKTKTSKENYIMGYMLNPGFQKEILIWHKKNRDVKAVFFWDKPDAPEMIKIHENLEFHKINATKFIQYLKNCKGYISTAGFESICEAAFFQKPILVVPTPNHFEQLCNAYDSEKNGLAKISYGFNVNKLINHISDFDILKDNSHFIEWVEYSREFYIEELTKF